MDIKLLKQYLATGERTPAMDGVDWQTDPDVQDTLEHHDRRFHPNGYKEGDTCKFRERLARGDLSDMFLDDIKFDAEAEEEKAMGKKGDGGSKFFRVVEGGEAFLPPEKDEGGFPVRITDMDSGESYVAKSPKDCRDEHDAYVYELVKEHKDDVQLGHTLGQQAPMQSMAANPKNNAYYKAPGPGLFARGQQGDKDAKSLAEAAAAFNANAGWGFRDKEIRDYAQAFEDMDNGKFPYSLPELKGKLNEQNFNSGDFDKVYPKRTLEFVATLASRPDLIRAYVLERLEDANFHKEVAMLEKGDYNALRGLYSR